MTTQELFIKHHWKQTIVLGVVTIMTVVLQVAFEKTNLNKNKTGVVLGVSSQQIKKTATNQNILIYQNKIKQIINNYLEQRANYNKPHQDWLFLINKTKQELILLTTPIEYLDLHTQLILLLDNEKKVIKNSNWSEINNINSKWDQLLKQFWWL